MPLFPLTTPEAAHRQLRALPPRASAIEPGVKGIAERELLAQFAPAYAVVNAEGDLIQSSGRTGKYLELPPGAPDTNIFNMARPGLRLELRAALHKAVTTGQTAARSKVTVGVNGGRQEIDIFVRPLRLENPTDTLYMIVFQDLGAVKPLVDMESSPPDEPEGANVSHLEVELRATKDRLQTTTEELESSNEELKSGNEELQSVNEELQSTNEELETSKEELQSINEELQTVNAELNARVEELSRANNDMSNLLESTQIATVFLDRTLAVKSFTPAAKDVFRLVESDTGRPITHVRARFNSDTLQEDAERVLRTLVRVERPVSSNENSTRYMMRMLPYRTVENVINGVVLTFTDVTQISAAEARIAELTTDLSARVNELETLLGLVPVGVMITDESAGILINAHGALLLDQESRSKSLAPAASFRLFAGDAELAFDDQPLQRARRTGEAVSGWQGRLQTGSGRSAYVMISATPLLHENGQVRGAIAAVVDISEHKQAEEHQTLLLHELQHRVKNILTTIASLATRMSRTSRTLDDFQSGFLSRIAAMGRVHDLLTGAAWTGATLSSVVEAALAPYASTEGSNLRLAGGELMLPPTAVATMGMVLNELATNASKYGSLSVPGGKVEVSWRNVGEAAERRVHLTWIERGGPPVNSDRHPGFGTGFITRSVEYELNGTAALEFTPEGVRCEIEFPLRSSPELPFRQGGDDALS